MKAKSATIQLRHMRASNFKGALPQFANVALTWVCVPTLADQAIERALWGGILVLLSLRVGASFLKTLHQDRHRTLELSLYQLFVLLGAGLWGSLAFLQVTQHGISLESTVALLIVAGLAGGSAWNLSVVPRTLNAYLLLILSPSVLGLYLHGGKPEFAMAIMIAFLIAFQWVRGKEVSQAYLESQQIRRALLDTTPGFVSWFNEAGQYTAVNLSLAKIYGIEPEQFEGRPIGFLGGDEEFKRRLYSFISKNIREETHEILLNTKPEPRWLLILFKRVELETHLEFAAIGIDIHDRKTAELALEQARLTAIHTAKLTSLGEMAGGIGHEINNPLAILSGKSQAMRRMIRENGTSPLSALSEKMNAHLQTIDQMIERMTKIVRGLKTIARDGNGDPLQLHDVDQVICDTLELCRARIESSGIELRWKKNPDPHWILCRPEQISQVLVNLLNNAYDAFTESPEQTQKWIEIKVEKDQMLRISVSNNGPPIPESVRAKLMQPFFTTKPVGKGTGLGLSISRKILMEHQGQLLLEPLPQGKPDLSDVPTVFTLELPNPRDDEAKLPTRAA